MNFGERAKERASTGAEVPVMQMPKYKESKAKAEELIADGKYGLDASDFWILKNETKAKDKVMYSGLIISHNGCLKINDKLGAEDQYDAGAASKPEWDEKGNLIMFYQSDRQGIYEVGEVSPSNCKNAYPYAMVVKRLFDRVVLKTSKVAFAGIYGEDEADEFKRRDDDIPESAEEPAKKGPIAQQSVTEINVAALKMLISEVKADEGKILNFYEVERLEDMNQGQWEKCMDILTRRKDEKK